MMRDLAILFEHPSWQEPLFAALRRRGVDFVPYDLKSAAFSHEDVPAARLYFNQASPSAYVRGNTRAVPYALALMQALEEQGARVLNGARPFALELSKSAQVALMRRLEIAHPRTWVFNDPRALRRCREELIFPAVLKPNQGGSGARMYRIEGLEEPERLLELQPELWQPDHLLLLQEYLPHDPEQGIVRLEFLGGNLLYAMRVIAPGQFNLCPSEVCHPVAPDATAACPVPQAAPPARFLPYPEVPSSAVEAARTLALAAGLDVGGIEYVETSDGRRVFYDVNANSNLRPSVAAAFGFDPFDRVVDFLEQELAWLPGSC
jgi:glutathione synthase/RimK-type ligase-like ATP-grasp enzyme